jgi:hypothetical protein
MVAGGAFFTWLMPMMTAAPEVKPVVTGWLSSRMRKPKRKMPTPVYRMDTRNASCVTDLL